MLMLMPFISATADKDYAIAKTILNKIYTILRKIEGSEVSNAAYLL